MKNHKSEEQKWFRQLTEQDDTRSTRSDRGNASHRVVTKPESNPQTDLRGLACVAGMDDLKRFLVRGLINVLKNPECAKAFGVRPPSILMYGPAGCGKTFFAEKAAEEADIEFMKIDPDALASQYLHGTQQMINDVFQQAEEKAPVLLFFDEFDTMVPKRSTSSESDFRNGETNEFLCKLNNAADRGIYVMAATNRPDCIDPAVLRPGRIDQMVYVDLPDANARESLFRLELSKLVRSDNIDYGALANMTQGYCCSDISFIVRSAALDKFNDNMEFHLFPYVGVSQENLEAAIRRTRPSIDSTSLHEYERLRSMFSKEGCRQRATIGYR